jgi:hypothetical protein
MFVQFFIASLIVANTMPYSHSFSQKVSSGRERLSGGEFTDWEIYSAEKQVFYDNGKVKEWRYGSIPGFNAALEEIKTFSPEGHKITHETIYSDSSRNSKATWFYDETHNYLNRFLDDHADGYKVDISYFYDNQHRLLSWSGVHNRTPVQGSIVYDDDHRKEIYNSDCVVSSRFIDIMLGDKRVVTLSEENEVINSQCYSGNKLLSTSTSDFSVDGTLQKEETLIYQNETVMERTTYIYDEYGNRVSEEKEYKNLPNDLTEEPLQIRKWNHKYEVDELGRLKLHTVSTKQSSGEINVVTPHYAYDDQGRLVEEMRYFGNWEEPRTQYTY